MVLVSIRFKYFKMCVRVSDEQNRSFNPLCLRFISSIVIFAGHALSFNSTNSRNRRQQTSEMSCFSHDSCPDRYFCAWTQCRGDDGSAFDCGRCLQCSMCLCSSNSTDFQCPQTRCPSQPTHGVLFWQGNFNSVTKLQNGSAFYCATRLSIKGNMFAIMQVPVSNIHPASSGTLILPRSGECLGLSRSGVLISTEYVSNGQHQLNVVITSEGESKLNA